MGSSSKKQRRAENQILGQFYVQSPAGKASLKDLDEVKVILNKLGEPYAEVLPDRELFYFFVIFAWNLSFADENIAEEELENFLRPYADAGSDFKTAAGALIMGLVERKKKLYPDELYTFGTYMNPPE